MTNEAILKAVVVKANKNGWSKGKVKEVEVSTTKRLLWVIYDTGEIGMLLSTDELLFDHDFAKAFWGEGAVKNREVGWNHAENKTVEVEQDAWQHHLTELALSSDRLAYIKQFIDK